MSVICRVESMTRCCAAARIVISIGAYVFVHMMFNEILFGKASYSERFDAHLDETESL